MENLALWITEFFAPVLIAGGIFSFGLSVAIGFVLVTLDVFRRIF